jgi:transcriptional regulator with XRE-family HTH domain
MASRDFARFFGEAVRRERKRQLLSQEKLAENCDLSMRMISLVEGCHRNPSVNVADSIAKGLGVPLSRLVKEAEDLRRSAKARKASART